MYSEAELIGTVLDGRYRILAQLGRGGMGTVYVAEHVGLGQRRAVKFLRPDLGRQADAVRRFLQEARTLSAIHHKNVVSVFDLGEHAGTAYYVMDLLDGEDLRVRLRREEKLSWAQAREIALQICAALATVHPKGIVHRDLKPENCFCVAGADHQESIRIIDFGVAKVSREAGGMQLTATGETVGTVAYMAPEQIEGHGDLRTDVYSLGVMLFEMLSGRLPHMGSSFEVIAKLARGVTPPRLRALCSEIDPAVEALVETAMAREPAARFIDMQAFAAAVEAIPAHSAPRSASTVAIEAAPLVFDSHGPIDPSAETLQRYDPVAADVPPAPGLVVLLDTRPALTVATPDVPPIPSLANTPAPPPRTRAGRWIGLGGFAVVAVVAVVGIVRVLTEDPSMALMATRSEPPAAPVQLEPGPPAPEPAQPGPSPPAAEPTIAASQPEPGPPATEPAPALDPASSSSKRTAKPIIFVTPKQLGGDIQRRLDPCRTIRDVKFSVTAQVSAGGKLTNLSLGTGTVPPGSLGCVNVGLTGAKYAQQKRSLMPGTHSISVVLAKR